MSELNLESGDLCNSRNPNNESSDIVVSARIECVSKLVLLFSCLGLTTGLSSIGWVIGSLTSLSFN